MGLSLGIGLKSGDNEIPCVLFIKDHYRMTGFPNMCCMSSPRVKPLSNLL